MWVHAVRIVVLKFKVLPKVVTDTIYLFFSHVSTSQKCRACLYIYAFSLRVSCHVSTPTMHILAHVCHMSTSLQITLEGNLWTKASSLDLTARPWYVHLPNMDSILGQYSHHKWNVVSIHQEPQEQHQATDGIAIHATSHPICEPHTENRLLKLPSTQPRVTFSQKVKNSWKNLFKMAKNKTASTKPTQVMQCFTAYFVSIIVSLQK